MGRKWHWHDAVLMCLLSGVLGYFCGISRGVQETMDFLEEEAIKVKPFPELYQREKGYEEGIDI